MFIFIDAPAPPKVFLWFILLIGCILVSSLTHLLANINLGLYVHVYYMLSHVRLSSVTLVRPITNNNK